MLRSLHIQNFALLSELTVDCHPGLTVITGETGAGKSIIVQAIAMLMGASATKVSVREGATVAVIEGCFQLREHDRSRLAGNYPDIEINKDGDTVLRREIRRSGHNRYFIDDQTISRAIFSEIGGFLLDINSQHSHHDLLDRKNHLALFDAATSPGDSLTQVASAYSALLSADATLRDLETRRDNLRDRRQLIQYQIREIDEAGLAPDEKTRLIEEREKIRHADQIRDNLQNALDLISYDANSLSRQGDRLARLLNRAMHHDPSLEEICGEAETIRVVLDDIRDNLGIRIQTLDIPPGKLDEISERIHFLQDLEGKYGNDIPGIIAYRAAIEEELGTFKSLESDCQAAREQWMNAFREYLDADAALSRDRRTRTEPLCRRIEKELSALGMDKARFLVAFDDPYSADEIRPGRIPERFTAKGTDSIRFMLSANPGVSPKPLSLVASGGELSRIMLALKQHLSSGNMSGTVIFDEVDTGIGGEVGNAVAIQLKKLSRSRQILCVTHLPQIAVRADHHIVVTKTSLKRDTRIDIRYLATGERTEEIARMLSGDDKGTEAMEHAESLLEKAAGKN